MIRWWPTRKKGPPLTRESFVSKVNSLDGCSIVYEGETGFVLAGKERGGTRHHYVMKRRAVEDAQWSDVEAVLVGGRLPHIMEWTSRVCGYYSNLRNWNSSKLAELKDRQSGNYEVN